VTAPARVLVLQNRFLIGGGERQTVLHLETVDRRAWEPVVACLKREGEHLDDLARLGVSATTLGVTKLATPALVLHVARLAARVRRERVAVVHAQDFFTNVLGTLAARLAGVPVAVTRVDLAHALDPARRALLAAISRLASRVVVNALCIRDLCLRDGVAADRIAVVRNGLDLARFDAEARAAAAGDALGGRGRWIVHVANMHHPVKGQRDLLLALREVVREEPDARLALVGDGMRRDALERLARELGVADRCTFLGARRDVPALLARAALAVSASHAEGISNAILEALAARRAVVATAAGGTPEVVRDGVTGLLVAPGAPAQLAARIVTLLRDPGLARRLGEAGRAAGAQDFGVEQMRQSYDALYRGLLAEAGRAPPRAQPAGAFEVPPSGRARDVSSGHATVRAT
jgi:glycosyltransferase involved in cell wall biosynthesis